VINVSSTVISMLPPQSAIYTATKGAVDAMTGEKIMASGGLR
jgi:NAD(P)-dependent dehydrogenase (short-subunit alcohol dehydrogenase family)